MRRRKKKPITRTFLDDVKRGATELAKDARRMARLARLKMDIRLLEDKMGESVYELGERTLELHQRNEVHHFELDDLFAELSEMQREIEDKRLEIEDLMALPPEEADDEEELPGERKYCQHCGAKVPTNARFCSSCGERL